MGKRILVVPDVHGRTFWEGPVERYINEVDRIVFLGDYLDPYPDEEEVFSIKKVFDNFKKIIALKQAHPDKVILLKGNHDQHYASKEFFKLACGSRCDEINWQKYYQAFETHNALFKLAHLETVGSQPYLFSHAGVTTFWIRLVNKSLWQLPANEVSLADPETIDRINQLDATDEGQKLLSVIGYRRSWFGEKSGSILWADIEEHNLKKAPKGFGMNKVFQVIGHTRLSNTDMMLCRDLAMTDSSQCFIIDEHRKPKIMTVRDYEDPHFTGRRSCARYRPSRQGDTPEP
ncbi:MAG: metallophosphoesterase [Prevotella sp.]|nr:metallophosphoesterase [Prevotella sp.]